jgi:hypothetical protein
MARMRASTWITLLGGAALVALGIFINRDRMAPNRTLNGGSSAGETDPASRDVDAVLGNRRPATDGLPFAKLGVAPEQTDIGVVSTCGPRRTFDVALSNDGEKAVRIDGWISTCACVYPMVAPGFVIEPGDVFTLPVAVEPWTFGPQSHRIDFRVSGDGLSPNAAAGRLRVNFNVDGPLRARPTFVTRPERARNFAVNLDRSASDGSFVSEAYDVLGVEPRVAQILPPLEPGHGAINIDFQAIDELAASENAGDIAAFEWTETTDGRRWKSIELTVRTSLEPCGEIRVRVRNKPR